MGADVARNKQQPSDPEGGGRRVIKKYPNRRLYDTASSSYITLSEVKNVLTMRKPRAKNGTAKDSAAKDSAAKDGAAKDSPDKDYSSELPKIPSKTPDESLKAIRLKAGFHAELVAADPSSRTTAI